MPFFTFSKAVQWDFKILGVSVELIWPPGLLFDTTDLNNDTQLN